MHEKHGVTGVLYDTKEGKNYFLLLHRVLNWKGWEFVKGGIDEGEEPVGAVLREVEEESGLSNVSIIAVMPKKVTWIAKDTRYIYTPFVLKANINEEVNLEQEIIEHDDFKWVLEKDVERMLTHEDNKKIFHEALDIIGQKNE